jgi:hypothetical protein
MNDRPHDDVMAEALRNNPAEAQDLSLEEWRKRLANPSTQLWVITQSWGVSC